MEHPYVIWWHFYISKTLALNSHFFAKGNQIGKKKNQEKKCNFMMNLETLCDGLKLA